MPICIHSSKPKTFTAALACFHTLGGSGRLAALMVMAMGLASPAQSTVIVWENSATTFSTGANWIGGTAPANDLTSDIGSFEAATVSFNPQLTGSRSINGLQFTSGTGAWTFTGNSGTRILTLGASGIVNSSSSTQTFTGINLRLTLGANLSFVGNSGTLQFDASLAGILTNGFRLTLDGASTTNTIAEIISGTGGLTKVGAGTWTLSGANSYSGTTDIGTSGGANGGTLTLAANDVLPGTTVNLYGGTLDINSRTDTVGALNLGGGAIGSTASITGTTGTLTLGGNITYSATNNANGAAISANLSLGGANRTVTVGNSSAAATDLTLGHADFSDTITMGANTLTIDGAGNTLIKAFVGASGDTGAFTKNGTGTTTFYGDRNFYTGVTTVNDGTLVLDTSNSYSNETIRGNLVIGDGTGSVDSATVRYGSGLAHNKIADTSQVTINSDGVLDLNSKDDTIGSFTLSGGHITTGTGVLTLAGNITTTANVAGRTAVIDGVLSLGSATRTFTVADDAPVSDLTVNATINSGSIIKAGAGTMTIKGDNTIGYGGTTAVNAGVLNIQSSGGLGQTGTNDPAKGTTVASGAALQLEGGGIAVGTEALTLTGTGVAIDGALRNMSGNNSWAGAISLGAGGARINSDSGTLTLSGSITAVNQNLTVGGAGNTTINGAIGTGAGTLTKDGAGTLTLAGNSTYGGATTISTGVVNIRDGSALGSTAAGTTVASGAALQIQNNISVGSETLSLTGTGVATDGALRNISGTNTWGGAVTIAAGGARINSDAGALTLAGNITLGANTLTVGGAGNVTASSIIAGTGGVTRDGSGTLVLSGANSYTGATTISAGTLQLGASGSLADSTAVTVAASGTFDVNGQTETIGSLAGAGSVLLGTGQLTAGGDNTSTAFAGTLAGTGSFTKEGTGTLTIGSNLGFGGNLNLTAGTLQFNVDNAFTGITTISAGTWRLSNANLTLTTLNITGSSTIDFAGSASTLSVTNLTISAGVTLTILNWQNATDYFFAQNWTGAVFDTLGAAPMNQVVFTGFTGNNTKWQGYDNQVTPVPEPSTYGAMLLGAGLAVFGLRRWRRSRGAQP